MIVCFGNCLTSIFAGITVFSVLGFMATEIGVEVKDVAESGTSLAFIVYPSLVTRLPWPNMWAFLFFFMLLLLGLDTQFAMVETILTAISDYSPRLRSKKPLVAGITCSVLFICGIPLATQVSYMLRSYTIIKFLCSVLFSKGSLNNTLN